VQFLAADNSIIASEVFTQLHAGIEFPPGGGNRNFYGVTTSTPIARIRTVDPGGDGHGVVYSCLVWGGSAEAGGGGETDPPVVTIDTPIAGAVVSALAVFVHATITDACVSVVTSTPMGVDALLPTGGGEAFGFVPLHLARALQSRGVFTAALDWFRSVYDYRLPVSLRKIYYGLKKEARAWTCRPLGS
jgi:hypothetical protein